jgi:two-component system, OmpR family, phosphate regulon sensor histidine kinase PhoR
MSFRTTVYVTLFVLAILLAIAMLVFWNIYIIRDYITIRELHTALHGEDEPLASSGRWIVLAAGITACAVVIVSLSLFFATVIRGTRFKQQQRDFTNMMTHELRLPLSGIQVFAQTLRQRSLEPEERNRFADGILSECARLGKLIDQLLKIQQIEQRQLLVHKKALEVSGFVASFVEKWHRPLGFRGQDGLRVEADPLLLEMVLTNFVTNAEKYGRESLPEIVVAREGHDVRIAVRDGGKPLSRKYLKRIFRKFYRVPDLNTRRQAGVGLGLYVVKKIAKLHKGSVRALPLSPEGNEFSICLPLLS